MDEDRQGMPLADNEDIFDKDTPKVLAFFLLYSIAMFSLPFATFYGTQHYLKEWDITGYANTVWSVLASVATIWIVLGAYAYHAYREDVVNASERNDLNLKRE